MELGNWAGEGVVFAIAAVLGSLSTALFRFLKHGQAYEKQLRDELRQDMLQLRAQMLSDGERCDFELRRLRGRIATLERKLEEATDESRSTGKGICELCKGNLGEDRASGSPPVGGQAPE